MATWIELGIGLPAGASGRNVKTTCPQCSHLRKHYRDRCLSVDVDRGLFRCHNTGCGFRGSLSQGEDEAWKRPPRKVYAKPAPLPPGLSRGAAEWFRSRGIDLGVVERRGVTGDEAAIRFPYLRDGELVNVKTRYRGKRFAMEAGCELVFWGLDACRAAEQVVIVEGELDALACETAGLPHVLSVPNGAQTGAMDFLASGEAVFDRCHTVVLAVDADPPGLALEAELARRIGKEKCWRVRWPDGHKDANEVLLALGAGALRAAVAAAEPFPLDGITTLQEAEADVMALYDLGRQRGVSTGWRSLDHLYTVRPGQLTVVTGIPGSGKSEWIDALMVNLIRQQGWGFGVYSPENFPVALHVSKVAEKWIGKPFFDGPSVRMSKAEIAGALDDIGNRLSFITPPEPRLDDILDRAGALVFRDGIKGLVIDPWNEIDHTRPKELTETEHISRSLTGIRQFARDRDVHVWLVAHPRMLRRDANGKVPIPTPYDISGSAHWFNKADNNVTVWRNKGDDGAPVEIHVQKVRFREVGQLGTCFLAYDRLTGQYRDIGRWEAAGAGRTAA